MFELIVNPMAGNGAAQKSGQEAAEILRQKKVDFVLRETAYPGHATELAQDAAARGVETVIACGGDGTVTEVAAGLRNTKTALGILPCGTGNDFIKVVGIPKDWRGALEHLLSHPARRVDTGLINQNLFMNICGTGFDVMVLDYAEKAKKKVQGIWPYLWGVLCTIFTFKPFDMHIEIGTDVVMDGKFTLCAVGNGRYFGGGIPITLMADPQDQLFDIVVVDAVHRYQIPFYLPSLMKGTLYKAKLAHHYRSDRCLITSPKMRVNIDGEIKPMNRAELFCEKDALLLHW